MAGKILFFNPKSAKNKHRIPNSILTVAASIEGKHDYAIVDANQETEPYKKIASYLDKGDITYFASTVMPGPQLKQAIPFTKKIRENYPQVKIIWGGYFPSNHTKVVLNSGYIDYVVNGPGDKAFPALLHAIENKLPLHTINNIAYKNGDEIIKTPKDEIYDQDTLPDLPYEKLNTFYPIKEYMGKTYLGTKTFAYHSSMGCPFTCSFCGIVPIFNGRWKAKSAENVYKDIKYLKENYGGNAIEFFDNNFFVSEKRTVEFSKLMRNENMVWWSSGRIDTVNKYKDESLEIMRAGGCKMIYFGAESGNDALLKRFNKGGTQSADIIRSFAARMKKFDIIPEYSFILGAPGETERQTMQQIDNDIAFIREIKDTNPATEIIIYVYSPVPTEGSELYNEVLGAGFSFPKKLDDWITPAWENFDLHKNPLTPWLTREMVEKIRNFDIVLNGYYPTVSDIKLTTFQRKMIKFISSLRYKKHWLFYPYEIKALQKYFLRYRQPEIEGF